MIQSRKSESLADRRSTFALAAKGNPQICLLGGLLLICVGLIFALVVVIVLNGLKAFVVRPIDLVEKRSGELFFAELQQVKHEVNPASEQITESRQYRTSNPILSGAEYQWLDEDALSGASVQPSMAMLIERFEIGRIVGLPTQLSLVITASKDATLNAECCEILAEYCKEQGNLDEAERFERIASNEIAGSVAEQVSQWQNAGAALVDPGTEAFSKEETRQAVYWETQAKISSQLQTGLSDALSARRRVRNLRESIAELDAQISDARLELRVVERQRGPIEINWIELSQKRVSELVATKDLATRIEQFELARIPSFDASNDQELVRFKEAYVENELSNRVRTLELEQVNWMEEVRGLDAKTSSGLVSYLKRYEDLESRKLPLRAELELLEHQLDRFRIHIAAPADGLPYIPSHSDTELLETETQVSEGLGQWLKDQIDVFDPAEAEVERLNLGDTKFQFFKVATYSTDIVLVLKKSPSTSVSDMESAIANGAIWQWQIEQISCNDIARAITPNQMSVTARARVYCSRWWEFLTTGPRLANTDGGVFPAIVGMVALTLIMTVAVLPLGVMAALYLSEYTKSGALVSAIRISINNLASVPSIIYGVFGFSFFCYTIGAFIDGGPANAGIAVLPPFYWYLQTGACACLFALAFFVGLAGARSGASEGRGSVALRFAFIVALIALGMLVTLLLRSPFFSGFFEARLPNPTFGKGGLLWAALTLALMNLPVVIVSAEEALAAVPQSLREGSFACGASRWQTIWRIVIPYARPGIVTGAVLAMARGTSVVAPLLLIGALPSVSGLPVDGQFPFVHGSRAFSHLGYWIFSLGAQNPNSDSTRTMVYASALLLLLIITALNLIAVYWRSRLQAKKL